MGAAYIGGQLITFGGENAFSVFSTVRAYNLATKTWSTLPSMARSPARDGRGGGRQHHLRHRRGIRCPGTTDPPAPCRPSSRPCPRRPFKFATSWTLGRISTFPVQQLHAAVLNGSQIWLAGGLTGSSEATAKATNQTEYYDSALHVWNNGPPLPFAVHHAMLVTYKNQLWLIGGFLTSPTNLEAAASNKVLILDKEWPLGRGPFAASCAGGRRGGGGG